MREQSKQIAASVREGVRDEKKRQLDNVNRMKQDELIKWRQKQLAQTDSEYKVALMQVGAAHRAAEREAEKMKLIENQKAKNRKTALQRGKVAAEKQRMKRTPVKKSIVKEKQVVTVATQIDDSFSEESDSSDTSLSSASSVCSVIVVKTKRSSPRKSKISPARAPKGDKSSKSLNNFERYNPDVFMSACSTPATEASIDLSSDSSVPRITKISEILKRQPNEPGSPSIITKPYTARTYKLDKSPLEPRTAAPKQTISKALKKISKFPPTRPSSILTNPIKKRSSGSSAKKTPAKNVKIQPYVPRFLPETKPHAEPDAPKVKFYDQTTLSAKEYDRKMNVLETRSEKAPMSAMEEAAFERIKDDNYLREVAELR